MRSQSPRDSRQSRLSPDWSDYRTDSVVDLANWLGNRGYDQCSPAHCVSDSRRNWCTLMPIQPL